MHPDNRCPTTHVVTKRYDSKTDRFVVVAVDELGRREKHVYLTLKRFVDELGDDVRGADLSEYRDKDEVMMDLVKKGAYIGREDLIRTLVVPECTQSTPQCWVLYMTDLHLDEKIARMMSEDPNHTPESCIEKIVDEVCLSAIIPIWLSVIHRPVILIGGDVSHDSRIVEMFYRGLRERRSNFPIIGILGNHELWDRNTWAFGGSSVESSSRFYSRMLGDMGACLLERSLIVYSRAREFHMMDENAILEATPGEIRSFTLDSMFTVFGGLGYSALSPKFNARNGMYKGAVDPDEERELSGRMARLYHKIREAIPDRTVVVFTHTPMHEWTDEDYQPGWVYVHGHDHHNQQNMDEGYREYADGQIGYEGTLQFNVFKLEWMRDIFIDRPDGIHTITSDEYRAFYFLKGMRMQSKMTNEIIMLKREGFYCFLVDDVKHGLKFLDGGVKRKASHDIQYYYDNMARFAELTKSVLSGYNDSLKTIASDVKAFGGRGRIHGCIVDIDFFNHLYVNPLDGKVTPYFARDIVDKTVYPSVATLLQERCPELYANYISLEAGECRTLIDGSEPDGAPVGYHSTDIYRISRMIYKFQRMEEYMVIRVWNDSILDHMESEESRQSLMTMLLGPGS